MKLNEKLQSSILINDIDQAKYLIREIKEGFIQINLYTILNMAILHSTPEIINLLMKEFNFEITEHILMKTLININTGSEEAFENYKTFIKTALFNMSNYIIEEEIVSFIVKKSKNRVEIMYKEEFLNVINEKYFQNKVSIELKNELKENINKEKLEFNVSDF